MVLLFLFISAKSAANSTKRLIEKRTSSFLCLFRLKHFAVFLYFYSKLLFLIIAFDSCILRPVQVTLLAYQSFRSSLSSGLEVSCFSMMFHKNTLFYMESRRKRPVKSALLIFTMNCSASVWDYLKMLLNIMQRPNLLLLSKFQSKWPIIKLDKYIMPFFIHASNTYHVLVVNIRMMINSTILWEYLSHLILEEYVFLRQGFRCVTSTSLVTEQFQQFAKFRSKSACEQVHRIRKGEIGMLRLASRRNVQMLQKVLQFVYIPGPKTIWTYIVSHQEYLMTET